MAGEDAYREVLECGSPLPFCHRVAGSGLPHSKTLPRNSGANLN